MRTKLSFPCSCLALLIGALLIGGLVAPIGAEPAKDICIKDDNGGGEIRINSETRTYVICLADGTRLDGTFAAVVEPGTGDTRFLDRWPVSSWEAHISPHPLDGPTRGGVSGTIDSIPIALHDSNIDDNDCTCQSPGSFGVAQTLDNATPTEIAGARVNQTRVVVYATDHDRNAPELRAATLGPAGTIAYQTTLATGSFFSPSAARAGENVAVTAINGANYRQLLWLCNPANSQLLCQAIVLNRLAISAGVVPYPDCQYLSWYLDFAGTLHREIRDDSNAVVAVLPNILGVGCPAGGEVEPRVAANGGDHVVVYQPSGGDGLFAQCHQNGSANGAPFPIGPVWNIPPQAEIRIPTLVRDAHPHRFLHVLGDERSGIVIRRIDCETHTAETTVVAPFSVPDNQLHYSNQVSAAPLRNGNVLVAYCHDGSEEDRLFGWVLNPDPLDLFPGLIHGPECEPGPNTLLRDLTGIDLDGLADILFAGHSLDRAAFDGPAPEAPGGPWLTSPSLDRFEVKVRVTAGAQTFAGRKESDCIADTLCVSGALPGRAEIFVRVPGPKPNGYLWPTVVKFSTSQAEVWIRQPRTGTVRYYQLDEVASGETRLALDGLAHKTGFLPPFDPAAAGAQATAPTASADLALAALDSAAAALDPAASVVSPATVAADPAPPSGPWLTSALLRGFRAKVRVTAGSSTIAGRKETDCITETLCVSAALPGRPEVFVRVVGPKPNGYLWPTVVKFSTSRIEVWIEQTSSDQVRYYELPAVAAGEDLLELAGVADKLGFLP